MKRIVQIIALFCFAGILLSSSCNGNGRNKKLNTRAVGTLELRVFGNIKMLAPKGINAQYYNEIGFTDLHNYESESRNVFISIDEFSKSEVDDFFKYYGEMSDSLANEEFLLKYANMKRQESLEDFTEGNNEQLKTDRGEKLFIKNIKGRKGSYADENTFMQACVKIDNLYYFIQLVSRTEDMKFYHADFMEMLKSIRSN